MQSFGACVPVQAHQYCSRCGSRTQPTSFGTKRQCTADSQHRLYPRTDSVVIMLVKSPDGRQALLGRSKNLRANMQTCLSGFVDQAESIEEVRSSCRHTCPSFDLLCIQAYLQLQVPPHHTCQRDVFSWCMCNMHKRQAYEGALIRVAVKGVL